MLFRSSLLLGELPADAVRTAPFKKLGNHFMDTNRVYFSDYEVPAGNIVGEEGKAWAPLYDVLNAEWIILTPHYVRPDWMGLDRERDIDQDPRPYVAGLRQFAAAHPVAVADAALRYGRLWRQGLPYSTLMLNSINHPDGRGMKIFADALMELFP